MLTLDSDRAPLSGRERFALDLLLDLSRVLRFEGSGDVVRLRVAGDDAGVPALASMRGRGWGMQATDGSVTIERELLRLVHHLAGGVAEQRSAARDRFGRVPSSENALVQEGLEREPVVSVIARALADAVRRAGGGRPLRFLAPWPSGRRWAAALSHDLDVVQWWPAFTALRLAELARKGELVQAARATAAALATGGRDVVWRGVRSVLGAERRHDVRSTWFILCGTPTFASFRAGDLTYRPESALARRILGAVRAEGHELGLHGSFATSEDHAAFAGQRGRLASLTGARITGVRQHFLRMRAGETHRGMVQGGFGYDSTSGFSDRNGFRLGVADVVPVWDDAAGAALPLEEAPFAWMDRALSKYAGVERPDAWIDDALSLADAARAVEGMWVGIWHPNLSPALGYPGAPEAYARLVDALVERRAWIAPIGELVAWRAARRAARGVALDADARLVLASPVAPPSGTHLALEDAEGRIVEARVQR